MFDDTVSASFANSTESRTARAAAAVLQGTSTRGRLMHLLPFLGPAFVAAVAYVDPGNIATNIQAGAQFGPLLIWVVVASNLVAMLIQALSAKLGMATGMNLAELCRAHFSTPVVWGMWLVAELVAIATDLAEFIGAAIGFQLLFNIPLLWGGILTAIATWLILGLERRGFRPLEAVIGVLIGIIAVCYIVETVLDQPDWGTVAYHAVVPGFAGTQSVLLAVGILGATVMPHAIFLHSALTQRRIVTRDPQQLRRLFRFEIVDIVIALGLAGLVNAAMLVMAASTFFRAGLNEVGTIEEAYKTLTPLLGSASSWIFAIALLASGLSSSAVGTLSGQVVMQGFLKWEIPIWLRRAVTMLPSLIVIALGLDPTRTLVLSQVMLSFGIPFALIPLVMFTRNKHIMGVLVNRRWTTVAAVAIVMVIVLLNAFLTYDVLAGM